MSVADIMRFCRIGLALIAAVFGTTSAVAQTPVKFALDWSFEGPSAPFLVALDRGYFKAAQLDIAIDPGNGSIEPIGRVASGEYDMGFADINSLIKFRDAKPDTPVKAVFMVYNRPAFAIISRKSRGVTKPKDLEGKKLGAPAADGAFAQWKIFAKANDIDVAKVTIENIGIPVRGPMLAAGQVDAITGYSFTTYVNLKERGVPANDIVLMLMADYGVDLYGNAIIVNAKFAAEKPEAVKNFLHAFLRGLKETVRNPTGAVESVLKRNELAQKSVELERLRMAIRDNILTEEVKKNGYGDIDMTRFEKSFEQIGLTYTFKTKLKPADVFDASYLPPAPERRAR